MHNLHRVLRSARGFDFRRLHPRNIIGDAISQVIWSVGCCLVFVCAFGAVACVVAIAMIPSSLLSR